MYGVYSLGGFALLSLAAATFVVAALLDRRCRRAPARSRSPRDLGDVPAGARRRAVGVVDPRADARAPAVHRPALAARLGGAHTDAADLARAPAARRLGERARQRRARRAARDAARRVRADPQPRRDLVRAASRSSLLAPLAVLATPYGPVETARYYHLLLVDPPFAGRVTEWRWAAPDGEHDALLRARGDRDRPRMARARAAHEPSTSPSSGSPSSEA